MNNIGNDNHILGWGNKRVIRIYKKIDVKLFYRF